MFNPFSLQLLHQKKGFTCLQHHDPPSLQPHSWKVSCAYLYPVSLGGLMSAWCGFRLGQNIFGWCFFTCDIALFWQPATSQYFFVGSKPPTGGIFISAPCCDQQILKTFGPWCLDIFHIKTQRSHEQYEPPVVLDKLQCPAWPRPHHKWLLATWSSKQRCLWGIHYLFDVAKDCGWIVPVKPATVRSRNHST